MKNIFIFITILILSVPLYSENGEKLLQAMVTLDRSYIPALGYTGQGKPALQKARNAMRRFEKAWKDFTAYNTSLEKEWRIRDKDIQDIENSVSRASAELFSGNNPEKAHEYLESIRQIFLKIRESAGLPYFLDDLTGFHDAMEKVSRQAVQSEALGRDNGKKTEFRKDLEKADRLFERAYGNIGLADRHGLDKVRMKRLAPMMDKERKILRNMKKYLAEENWKSVREAGQNLKKQFVQIYFLFGDF